VSRLSPCRRGSQTPRKLAPHGTDDGHPSTCCSTRRREHGSYPWPPHPPPHPRTHTRGTADAGMPTRKRRFDPQIKLRATHARACAIERSRPTPASRHHSPIRTDRHPFATPATWAVTPVRARKSPRSPNQVPPFSDLTGTVLISRWKYVAYICSQLAINHE